MIRGSKGNSVIFYGVIFANSPGAAMSTRTVRLKPATQGSVLDGGA